MGKYICRICRKPIVLDEKTLILMEVFDMPVEGGAHQSCLDIEDVRQNTKQEKDNG